MQLLQPGPDEIERLALRETDPSHYAEFEPITRGPVAAVVIVLAVGMAAVLVTPFRLLRRWIGTGR